MGRTTTMRRAVALGAYLGAAGAAPAGTVFLEIAPMASGPGGFDNGGGQIGVTETLGVWIWSDEPRLSIAALGFDIVGRALDGGPGPDPAVSQLGLGQADPLGVFPFFTGDGALSGSGALIDNIELVGALVPPIDPGVAVPADRSRSLLVYADFEATPLGFAGGAFLSVNFLRFTDGSTHDIVTYGFFQTPTPGAILPLAGGLVQVSRRRRST